jgi:hypothetical protein
MASFKYFSDFNGETTELLTISTMVNKEFEAKFPGIKGIKDDGFSKRVGRSADGEWLPMTRAIEMKARPSLHVCNAKCLNGKCNGACECRCGGRNHGRGNFLLHAY